MVAAPMTTSFSAPGNFINRELSWLEFNRRVLEEAQDRSQPLLERVKFLSIFSSNLDEFFEIRVAGIKQQILSSSGTVGPDEIAPPELFGLIQKKVHGLIDEQYRLWKEELVPDLAAENIRLHEVEHLAPEKAAWAHRYFREELFPLLTPLAVDASHPFPQVVNKSHNILVRARKQGVEEPLYAVVQVPRVVPHLICLPRVKAKDEPWEYIFLASLIRHHIGELFPGLEVESADAFRITRNSDLYIDDEEADNLLRTIEQELRRAHRGSAVRLEIRKTCPAEMEALLCERFGLSEGDVYRVERPLSMTHLLPLIANEAFSALKDRPYHPSHDPAIDPSQSIFSVMRSRDVMLHHPYETFDTIIDLLERAAKDPHVLAIKMTLYRTSGDSPLVGALMTAARNGKQVTALVELKARFDEANNIQWARKLEEAGVHVVYGVVGLKTHCKALLIVRRDEDRIRFYVHLGTGNYHPSTARIYTDLSLLTTAPELTQELATFFNALTGLTEYPGFEKLMVAPFDMCERLKEKIDRERDHALSGRAGRIIIKVNALVDEELIRALYEASCAGVKIDLIVRGICCLRPNIPAVSENIRVISIVGRFLEHSRIFYFANNGQPEVYLSSADWMPRNLYRRVELAFLIENAELRDELIHEILPAYIRDKVKARELQVDGSYVRLKPAQGEPSFQAQLFFRTRSRSNGAPAAANAKSKRFIPVQKPAGH